MKNLSVKVLVLTFVVAISVLIPTTGAVAAPPATSQYVALGDSFAEGVNSPVPERTGYVAQVASRYFNSAYTGTNQTVNLATGQTDTTTDSLMSDGQFDSALAAIGD